MVKKNWQDLEPGECAFWRHRKRVFWNNRKSDVYVTVLVVACPKCGEPAEVGSDYMIVSRGEEQIHVICPLTCPGEDCHAKYYCSVGRFEFVKQ